MYILQNDHHNNDSFPSMPLVRLPLLSPPFLHQASLTVPQHSHSFTARLPESILALLLTYSLYAVNSVSKQLKPICSRIYKNGFISHQVNLNWSPYLLRRSFLNTLSHPNPAGMPRTLPPHTPADKFCTRAELFLRMPSGLYRRKKAFIFSSNWQAFLISLHWLHTDSHIFSLPEQAILRE